MYLSLMPTTLLRPPCSERSLAEARLRSQLEASTRKGERLGDDVRALTATKGELEAEVGATVVHPWVKRGETQCPIAE